MTTKIQSLYNLSPTDVKGFDSLADLALDLRSSWNHATDEVWRQLDPELWEITQNPWVVLQTVSRQRIEQVLNDADFRKKIDQLAQLRHETAEQPAWFQQNYGVADRGRSRQEMGGEKGELQTQVSTGACPLTCAAYFSMEFMLSEALPIYSGGLGNVAGDQLKAASDLGVPVVAVGLLYQQGYFRQTIDKDGRQQALYPYNDPGQLPITPLRDANGQWLRLNIDLPGYSVWLRAWQVQVGRVKLYLLDSNDAANFPEHRGITSELYGGGPELRLKQELILGIGGWRLLTALGIEPEVCHLNEGHAAFAVLERARGFMEKSGQPFEIALEVTRAGNLFTTHTAVAAGFDRFSPNLIEQYLARYAQKNLGLSVHDLMALGRLNPNDASESFNMAYLAIRGSSSVNGVSRLHGKVSRRIFEPLFPRWPEEEVPVGYVTNGVHMPSWDSQPADELWTHRCGKSRWLGVNETLACDIRSVSDEQLWQFRIDATHSLVDYARQRLSRQLAASGSPPEEVEAANHLFDPNTLTLGFARRFATYKRPNLLLHDPERLLRLLSDAERPVQLIIAGKAHPADLAGQELIRQWIEFIRRPVARKHVIFLSDYDMLLTEHLVQGTDVWVNTPRRPWEASGTSGMKVLVNGGINLSELDGWWAEAYTPEVGWAIGDGQEHGDDPAWDAVEAEQLYDLLEHEVIPEFYNRNEHGIPTAWLARMRASMSQLTPQFSAVRTVREYTEQHYLPAAAAYQDRIAYNGAMATSIVNWKRSLREKWGSLRFGNQRVQSTDTDSMVEVEVYLDGLDPNFVRVELYADGLESDAPTILQMKRVESQDSEQSHWMNYQVVVPAGRPVTDYTPRIVPHHAGVSVPLELDLIRWRDR
ncbi:alpha-glucan family phosphorylase [Novipirellula aureliae]|nr:alpha-glucan family phosphorylase [Novipirellula aureliae]